jgi:hypothetical protein
MPHECIFEWIVSQIHFGVSGGLPRFALENQAVIDTTFACPDELGWKPQVALLPNCLFSLSTYSNKYCHSICFICFIVSMQSVPIVPSDGNISRIRKVIVKYEL